MLLFYNSASRKSLLCSPIFYYKTISAEINLFAQHDFITENFARSARWTNKSRIPTFDRLLDSKEKARHRENEATARAALHTPY